MWTVRGARGEGHLLRAADAGVPEISLQLGIKWIKHGLLIINLGPEERNIILRNVFRGSLVSLAYQHNQEKIIWQLRCKYLWSPSNSCEDRTVAWRDAPVKQEGLPGKPTGSGIKGLITPCELQNWQGRKQPLEISQNTEVKDPRVKRSEGPKSRDFPCSHGNLWKRPDQVEKKTVEENSLDVKAK